MRLAVIGAGVTGLVAARRARELGAEVTLFDASQQAGGLAAGFLVPGVDNVWLEKFYHHIFRTDTHVVRLIEECGLSRDLMWRESRPGIFARDRTFPLGGPIDLLKCKPVGTFLDRLKMGLSLRVFQKAEDWRPFDRITCEEFFESRGALRAYRNLWEPLLQAKFGPAFANIPAAFLWGRIYPRSRSREKGRESLGYLRGGFARMFVVLAQRLEENGVALRLNTRVDRIERAAGGAFDLHFGGGKENFERIIWTAPPHHLARVLDDPEPALVEGAEKIKYIGACCLILLMDRPISDYYWVNNISPDLTFGGCIEHTNLVPPEEYGGRHIAYIINYLPADHPHMSLDVESLFRTHLPSLKRFAPAFHEKQLTEKILFKSPVASPLYDRGFAGRMPPFAGWSPGIGLLGMPQVYPLDRNMNHCIEVALRADMEGFLADPLAHRDVAAVGQLRADDVGQLPAGFHRET
ncbi:MAG TPA: FAD-dependent oxidoreductase [Chthoniobacterales bacterium]|nr:FAD-dependent oxidoreductase [Chthoniobacterales bacterium]